MIVCSAGRISVTAIHLRKLAVSHGDNHLFHLPSFLTVSYLSRCARDDQPIPTVTVFHRLPLRASLLTE